jgi:hypothetical protein
MHALYSLALAVVLGVLDGAVPQAAVANVRPLTDRATAIFIARAGRKTFSFPIYRHNSYGDDTSGAYARTSRSGPRCLRLCHGVTRP